MLSGVEIMRRQRMPPKGRPGTQAYGVMPMNRLRILPLAAATAMVGACTLEDD